MLRLHTNNAIRFGFDDPTQNTATKTMFGFWHAFFPATDFADDSSNGEPAAATAGDLLACALRDPNVRCRAAALHAALSCLSGSRAFLTQAENRVAPGSRGHPTAFTPFAVALGDQVVRMYATLGRVIGAEPRNQVLVQALKTLIVLVQQTTFARLRAGFLAELVVPAVRRLLRHGREYFGLKTRFSALCVDCFYTRGAH